MVKMDTNKYPLNWRERNVFPDWPTDQPRDIYQLDENGDPYNTLFGAEDVAEIIWPGGEGTIWAVSPTWCPWGIEWDGVRLTDPALDPPPPPPEPPADEEPTPPAEEPVQSET